jgi:hypothetical protein
MTTLKLSFRMKDDLETLSEAATNFLAEKLDLSNFTWEWDKKEDVLTVSSEGGKEEYLVDFQAESGQCTVCGNDMYCYSDNTIGEFSYCDICHMIKTSITS